MNTEQLETLFISETLGYSGRMIAGSKSGYRRAYPENMAIFNANLIAHREGAFEKIWYGDLDLTVDADKLLKVSENIGAPVYVLHEMDARFENEETPNMSRYVACYDASKAQNIQVEIGASYRDYTTLDGNVIKLVKP